VRVDRPEGGDSDQTEIAVPRAPTWEQQPYTEEATLANAAVPEDEEDDDAPSVNPTTHYPVQSRADPGAAPPEDDVYLEPGTQLGEYQIEAKIGEGGMGVVYAAVHPLIGKRAAVKVLKAELCRSAFNVERFIDEARVVNKIGHPNIVDVFAFGRTTDGRSYFIMEWLKGESLRTRIARTRLDLDEVCAIVKQLARALEAAHEHGVIHRDLKPDNIFLIDVRGDTPIVKLLDFGIAKLAREEHRMERTATGAMVGTPQYIAPEQAKGYAIDHRVDIYALGGIIFELLTGRPPYVADNAMEMVAKHLMEAVPRASSLTTVPEPLDDLVLKMLAKDPAGRPPLAEVFAVIERTSQLDRTNVKGLRTPVPAPSPLLDSAPINIPTPTPASSPNLEHAMASEPLAVSLPGTTEDRLSITDLAETIRSPRRPTARNKTMPIILGAVFLVAVAGAYLVVSSLKGDPKKSTPEAVTPPPPQQPTVEPPKPEPPVVKTEPAPEVKVEPPNPEPAVVKKDPVPPPPPKKPRLGKLQLMIAGGNGTTKITIDGVASGPSKELAPGPHTVVVSSKGHKTQTVTVTVREGGTVTKSITLEAEPPPKPVKNDELMAPGSLNEKKER
jgi:serine/threonine-protein kinase